MNKLIGLVGGAGFLGSRLSRRFKEADRDHVILDIAAPDFNDDIKYQEYNIESSEDFDYEGINVFINLAAEHRDDISPISRYDDVNIKGSVNICEAARKFNVNKIIFTSSVAIYGFAPPNTDESGKPNYFNDYGRTKYLAEQVYKEWYAEDPENRTLVIVRPTVIFGEGNRGNVFNLLKQIATKRFMMFGHGRNKKSMAYVENVAAFIEYSLSFQPGLHIYNYIDKPDFDMNSLVTFSRDKLFGKRNVGFRLPSFFGIAIGRFADYISKVSGKKLPISYIRVKKFMGTTQFISSVSKTGFVPPTSLEEGLAKTLHYEFIEDNSGKRTYKTE